MTNEVRALIEEIMNEKNAIKCASHLQQLSDILEEEPYEAMGEPILELKNRLKRYDTKKHMIKGKYHVVNKTHSIQRLLCRLLDIDGEFGMLFEEDVHAIHDAAISLAGHFSAEYQRSISKKSLENVLEKFDEKYDFFNVVYDGNPQCFVIIGNRTEYPMNFDFHESSAEEVSIHVIPSATQFDIKWLREYSAVRHLVEDLMKKISGGERVLHEKFLEVAEKMDVITVEHKLLMFDDYVSYMAFGIIARLLDEHPDETKEDFIEFTSDLVTLFEVAINICKEMNESKKAMFSGN